MPNPFYTNRSNQNNVQNTNLNELYNVLLTSKNPMQAFNNIAKNNPRMAPILNMLNNGISPQQIFMSMCQQRGINPQDFLNKMAKQNSR